MNHSPIIKPKSILVVDDCGMNRLLPGLILRPFGWDVYESESGVAAIEFLVSTPISCVLLDISMPEMNGIDVLKSLRRNAYFDHLKIIAYTAFAKAEDVSRLLELGFDAVLIKPLTSVKLLEILKPH
jgi:CheY-like chemotaxis protein